MVYSDFLGLITSIFVTFRIAQSVLLGIDILYVLLSVIPSGIRIDGIVPTDCALKFDAR